MSPRGPLRPQRDPDPPGYRRDHSHDRDGRGFQRAHFRADPRRASTGETCSPRRR